MEAKLATFVSVAKVLEVFLTLYQTDRVMVPFIAGDLEKVLRTLMRRFIKSSVLSSADTVVKLIQIDVGVEENYCERHKIDPGFVADQLLSDLSKEKKISELQALQFRF